MWEQSDRTEDVFEAFELAYDTYINDARVRQPDLDLWMIPPISKDVNKSIANYRKRGLEKDVPNYKTFCEEAEWEVYRFEDGTKALELELEFVVGGITVKGAIDALHYWPENGVITITDIKSGNLEEYDVRQLGVYAYAVGVQFGLTVKHGRYFWTKSNKIGEWHDLTRYDEAYLSDQFQTVDRIVSEKLFMPSPGDHCKLCAVKPYCREMGTKTVGNN